MASFCGFLKSGASPKYAGWEQTGGTESFLLVTERDNPVKAARIIGRALIFKFKGAVVIPSCGSDAFPIQEICRGLDDINLTRRAGEREPARRITKAYGSMVYKGDDTPERPCRRSKVIETASKPATLEQVSAVADEFAPPSKLQSFTEAIDQPELKTQIEKVLAYLDHNDIEYKDAIVADSMVKIPVTCPNEREHTTDGIESSTIVTVSKSGAFGFNCQHAHCADLCGWRNFRRRLDKKFSMLHADEPPFQWTPQAYLSSDTQNDEEPKPEVEPFVQPSIIVPARKKTLHEKAVLY